MPNSSLGLLMFANVIITAHAIDRFVERIDPDARAKAERTIRQAIGGAGSGKARMRRHAKSNQCFWEIASDQFIARVAESREQPGEMAVVTVIEPKLFTRRSPAPRLVCRRQQWARGGVIRQLRWRRLPDTFDREFGW